MTEAAASPLQAAGFRWLLLYRILTLLSYQVVESGAERAGRWLGYRRDVLADYRRVFGGEPGRIRHVGLLADTDDLKVRTDTWFANLAFSAA